MKKKLSLEATNWHYLSKGEYPTDGETVLVAFQEGGARKHEQIHQRRQH